MHWLGYSRKKEKKEAEFIFDQHFNQVHGQGQGENVEPVVEHEHDHDEVDTSYENEGQNVTENDLSGSEVSDNEFNEEADSDNEVPEHEEQVRHWRELPPIELYHKMYGYNMTDIPYPFQRDKDLQAGWMARMNGIYSFPQRFVPVWSQSSLCKHNNEFDQDDAKLRSHSKNIVVYTNIGERVFDVQVMYRKTVGSCSCIQQYDSHKHLLWQLYVNSKYL